MLLAIAATERELAVVRDVQTVCCGIGPVEAAVQTARALAERRPRGVLHFGLAGGRGIEPSEIVLGSEAIYHDIIDPGSTLPRVVRAEPDGQLLAAARRALPGAHVLPIATCGRVNGATDYVVEAMEGFSVLRAASLAGIPALEVRAISNSPDESDRGRWRFEEALAALAEALPRLIAEFGDPQAPL